MLNRKNKYIYLEGIFMSVKLILISTFIINNLFVSSTLKLNDKYNLTKRIEILKQQVDIFLKEFNSDEYNIITEQKKIFKNYETLLQELFIMSLVMHQLV